MVKFDKKTIAIMASLTLIGAGGATGLGYLAWKKWFKKDIVPKKKVAYDPFSNTGMQGLSASTTGDQCMAACTADPACTVYVTHTDDPSFCETFAVDPASAWTYSPSSVETSYVKRLATDPALTWSAWGACDKPCNGGMMSRKCSAANKCPGPNTTPCNSQACDSMIQVSTDGSMVPYPDQKGSESDVATAQSCIDKCLGDPTCTGVVVRANPTGSAIPEHCTVYNSAIDELQAGTKTTDSQLFYVRGPTNASNSWGAFPACGCGIDKVERKCTAASGLTCGGPKYFKCPNVACAYDAFPNIGMQHR